MISVENVHKKYGNLNVLNGLSVQFPKGKVTSLIGGNGAGKSTLLGIISGLLGKDEGKISLEHENIATINRKELAKKLAFLKQTNQTHIRLTVRELVSFGRFPYTQGKKMQQDDEAIVDKVLGWLDLDHLAARYLDQLSGGQRQRAYLALILAQDTEYILLDEPLNNLDMKYTVQVMKIIREITEKQGKTVIMIVHDINIVAYYSDYIAALDQGTISYFGPTDEIIKPEILKDIFALDFEVLYNTTKPVCLYYQ